MYTGFKFIRRKYCEHKSIKAAEAEIYHQDGPAQSSGGGAHRAHQPGTANGLCAVDVPSSPASPAGEQSPSADQELTQEEKADKKRMRIYRLKIILGLFAPFMLQALDTTIVAAALPTIASEFHAQAQENWIISAFNLTSAAFLPFWAQAADILGRHTTLQLTIFLTALGSAVCTAAPTSSLPALLAGRALQGVGAAGVNICVRTILADRVSLADYARSWSLFAVAAAVGYTVGPVVGGYLVTSPGGGAAWRWCFAVNLPVAAAASVLVVVCLRGELLGPQLLPELRVGGGGGGAQEPQQQQQQKAPRLTRRRRLLARLATIDYAGQSLFLLGLGLLILALTWAGTYYPWRSPQVLAPLVVGAALTAAWFAFERSMVAPRAMSRAFPRQRAMVPWELMADKDMAVLFLVNFCYGMCMYAIMYFMDYYFQFVQGQSASEAGTALLYFLPGLGAGAYAATLMTNRFPRQTIYPLVLGSLCSAAGMQVLCWALSAGRVDVVYGMMALAGFGVGLRMSPSAMHGLALVPDSDSSSGSRRTAQVTCVFAFALPLGGVVGLTLMSTVYNNKLRGGGGGGGGDYEEAIVHAYYAVVPFMWVCFLACLFLGNVWVGRDGGHEVVGGAYLVSLVTRRKLARETRRRGDEDWASGLRARGQTEGVVCESADRRKDIGTAEPV